MLGSTHVFLNGDRVSECQFPNRCRIQSRPTSNIVAGSAALYDHHVSATVERDRLPFTETINAITRSRRAKRLSAGSIHAISHYSSTISGLFRNIVSLITWSKIDLGSSTGRSNVFPKCWLYCKHQASRWLLLQYSLIVSAFSRSQTPSSL